MVLQGWQNSDSEELRPYQTRQNELSVHQGCILWGTRVIIPPRGREKLVEELHESHPGICRMKSLARAYVWWPRMDRDLENKVRACTQQTRPQNPPVTIHPWEWPKKPWVRLHLDYAGPVSSKMHLVLIDAHSKWLEVKPVNSATSKATIEHLRSIFSVHGLPEIVVTDNGTAFTSSEFAKFMKLNGIRHVRMAPYHPASNGQAERAVKIFKEHLKKGSSESLDTQLSRFLFRYRITPHSVTGVSPAELLMGQRSRSQLDLVRPNVEQQVYNRQLTEQINRGGGERTFSMGNPIFAKNFASGQKWLLGTIVRSCGPCSYLIELPDGRMIRRHVDHVRARSIEVHPNSNEATDDWVNDGPAPTYSQPPPPVTGEPATGTGMPVRRSTRTSHPPDRYGSSS